MTALAYAVAAALALVAGAATAYAAVARSRAAASLVAAAVLATSARSVPSLEPHSTAFHPEGLRAAALVVLAAVMVSGLGHPIFWVVAGSAMTVLGPTLLRDPFRDPACRGQCTHNPWALTEAPTEAAWIHGLGLLVGVLALLVMASRQPSRLALGAGSGIACVWLLSTVGANPQVLTIGAGACGLIAFSAELARSGRQRSRLRAVVDQLAHAEDAEAALREQVPGLQIQYHLDGVGGWVDRRGVRAPQGVASAVVVISGPEGAIARVVNPGSPTQVSTWSRQLRGPARLALDNARRSAQSAFEANEIAQSSRRLVASADEERRRLERDLHDGAQQHVLTLGLLLNLHLEGLSQDDPVRTAIKRSQATVALVLDDLRDLSHGIHAAALDTRGGLRQALGLLANRSPVPLDIGDLEGDPDSTTRLTAYALVEEVTTAAAGPVHVETCVDGAFEIRVTVDGGHPAPSLRRSPDRFRALGGDLTVVTGHDGRHRVTGSLPSEAVPPTPAGP